MTRTLRVLPFVLAVFCLGSPAGALYVPRVPRSVVRGPVCAFCSAPALSPIIRGSLNVPGIHILPLAPVPGLEGAVFSVPQVVGPVSLSAPTEAPARNPVFGTFQEGAGKLAKAKGDSQRGEVLKRMFEGSAAPREDEDKVYPHLIVPEAQALENDLDLAKSEVFRAVEAVRPRLEESVRHGEWNGKPTTLDESCCGDAAPKLGHLLRQEGYPADLVEAEFHYYLMFHLDSGQIVVDPTIRQFFGGARAPPGVPRVFVGTIEDLNALFRRYERFKTTSFSPRRIYFSDAVIRNSKIEKVRLAAEKNPSSPEYRPLSSPLALPRPSAIIQVFSNPRMSLRPLTIR